MVRFGAVSLCWLAAVGLCGAPAFGQEWTRFRGPDGSGIGKGESIPVSFTEADFAWRVKLPGPGHSSPVLWGKRIFLTCVDKRRSRRVVCVDADDGRVLWSWKASFTPYRQNKQNSYAASTPAVDARGVYISWVSGKTFIVLALDHEGRPVWRRELGQFSAEHGAGASPIVLDGVVIAGKDCQSRASCLVGLDSKTGRTLWQRRRKRGYTSYVTPAVYRRQGRPAEVIFASAAQGITSIDPGTGRVNWEVGGLFTLKIVASPVVAGEVVFASSGKGGRGLESAAVVPADAAAGRKPHVAYRLTEDLPYVPTPIAVGEYLFIWDDAGMITCVSARTGKRVWRQSVGGRFYSSPVCVNGRIYGVSRKGEVVVIEAAPAFKLLARSRLPERSDATPAIANGRMYIRTLNHLICIGGRKKAGEDKSGKEGKT